MVRSDGYDDGEYEHFYERILLRVVGSALFSGSWIFNVYDWSVGKFERYRENRKQRDDEWRKRNEHASRRCFGWSGHRPGVDFRDVRVRWRGYSNAFFIRDGVEWKFERGGVVRGARDETFIVFVFVVVVVVVVFHS